MKKQIEIMNLYNESNFKIEPLSMKRSWMSNVSESNPYQCVPLNVANQHGWVVVNPTEFSATWDGRENSDSMQIKYKDHPKTNYVLSHFNNGTITIIPDFAGVNE
jgi:hypothetical protein